MQRLTVAVVAIALTSCSRPNPDLDAAASSRVAPTRLADIAVTLIDIDPAEPIAGQTVRVMVTVANVGDRDTPRGVAVGSGAQKDGRYIGAFFVRDGNGRTIPLRAGQSYTAQIAEVVLDTGVNLVCVFADDINRFEESDETNNRSCRSFEIAAPDPCDVTFGPQDFGRIGGAVTRFQDLPANALITDPSCEAVTIRLTPGSYVYASDVAHAGIDLRGRVGSRTASANVEVVFAPGDYYFNHELFFTAFGSEHDLVVRGAGVEHTRLTFCHDPPNCECVDARPDLDGCQPTRTGYSMFHFRLSPRQVVVRDLALIAKRHDGPGARKTWEFETGISLCMDASECRDIVIEDVSVDGAHYSVLAKRANGLTIARSRLVEGEIGFYAATGPHSQVLLRDNDFVNASKYAGPRYGIFATGALLESAIVGNQIANVSERGIYPGKGSSRLWIHGNQIDNAGIHANGAGINLGKEEMSDVLVSANWISLIGDGGPAGPLGGVPITVEDDLAHDPNSRSVSGTTRWPNRQWNGYGIQTSGAHDGAIGIVSNVITDVATHGILVHPGASHVAILDNRVLGSGVNGLSIVPGYAYQGQFDYVTKGPIEDVWVEGNELAYNGRAGLEILPRGLPLFAVACTDSTACPHSQTAYPLCERDPSAQVCVRRYSEATCGDHCFDPAWQGYDVQIHDNRVSHNGLANLIVNSHRVAGPVRASYTISGLDRAHAEPSRQDNFHLYPSGFVGEAFAGGCATFGVEAPLADDVRARYGRLLTVVQQLEFRQYRDGVWSDAAIDGAAVQAVPQASPRCSE